mgnify:FL=1
MSFLEGFVVGAVSVIIFVAYLEQRGDDLSPVEQAEQAYREGHIDSTSTATRMRESRFGTCSGVVWFASSSISIFSGAGTNNSPTVLSLWDLICKWLVLYAVHSD